MVWGTLGAKIAGKGGFCLLGDGLHLNLALIKFGLDFLEERGFTSLQTPSFMTENIMGKCTHSVHFDKELYKVIAIQYAFNFVENIQGYSFILVFFNR